MKGRVMYVALLMTVLVYTPAIIVVILNGVKDLVTA
jgi:hypothetical protein